MNDYGAFEWPSEPCNKTTHGVSAATSCCRLPTNDMVDPLVIVDIANNALCLRSRRCVGAGPWRLSVGASAEAPTGARPSVRRSLVQRAND